MTRRGGSLGVWAVASMLLTASVLVACERKPTKPEPVAVPERILLTETAFAQLPGWQSDSVAEALPALRRSCARLLGQPSGRPVGPNGLAGRVLDWRQPCAALERLPAGDDAALRVALETGFVPFEVAGPDTAEGLFTGYYEAELRGALRPEGVYRWPLFTLPEDLVTVDLDLFRADLQGERIYGRVQNGRLVPYYSREEIDDGALTGRGLELLWVDDPVDAFFLHVQGSGRVTLPDGSTMRVGFAGSNGRTFYAIGRALVDEGKVPRNRASMQGIRTWLRGNPQKAAAVMQRNSRYIFFRRIDGEGPIGAQGVALTAGRSLAVDPSFLPLGAPVWLDTTWPASDRPLRRLMVAQDSGSAIKGPVRGDFFWGAGEPALAQAGRMRQRGTYYLLLPKTVAERRRTTS
ncbi:MAG: murein transglycosylase A [Rhodospirillales bacterium]|nr:murein transglycosylase A [Rhodospirillales bacterium]MDH3912334.1 murein transglycosylase A [Rhodospirillales bacterium]MDH3965723.1 murein transglycosylase A [Rhodospirillales bacterium]